jgi:16S rRNA processing protein RimM
MDIDSEYIVIGKLGAPFGIKGWLKMISFTEVTADALDYTPWFLEDAGNWKEVKYTDAREHGKGFVVKFAGYNAPETARALTGKKIAIKRTQLAALEEDEYYWAQLEGLTVIDQKGDVLGTIVYFIETGTNDVMVVKGQGKEFAIPYLPGDVVLNVDLEKQVMLVNWDLI